MTLRKLLVRGLALGLLAGGSAAPVCNPVSIFACDTDESCVAEGGEGGECESNSYCSFPDTDCPSTRRWHDRASSDLAGDCVGDELAGTGDDGGSGTQGSGSTGGATADDADGSTSSTPGSTSAVTTVPAGDSTDDGPAETDGGGSTSATGGSGGMATMTCDEQYGAVAGYELCDEQPDTCSFNALTMRMTINCNDVCASAGGMCLGTDFNEDPTCTATGETTCDDMSFGDGICTCDRA
ncbi:MAG: hypothetical protein JKY37_25200 [Nannocystaceae bacterium]|nr:hypothetical protein [Nannocystaceae bacterium]